MIITRTPFRITLGGGGTDLSSYYEKNGGFLVTSAIDKYMFVAVNVPFIDRLLRVKYSKSETVKSVSELEHELAREALKHFGITDCLEIISFADISAGTGMGSSSCYLVGLINALQIYLRRQMTVKEMAELACHIEIDLLHKPIGKQDAYIASYGGITVLEIAKDGTTTVKPANVKMSTVQDMEHNLLLYYSGVQRQAETVLADQHEAMLKSDHVSHKQVSESLNYIKELGYKSLKALEEARLSDFGRLMDEHWQYKKKMSQKISNPLIDQAYEEAKKNGALGGKLLGAGGGGFLFLYTEERHKDIDQAMQKFGMRRLDFRFDFEGSKALINLINSRVDYAHGMRE